MKEIEILVTRLENYNLDGSILLPQHIWDAGVDIRSVEDVEIKPGETRLIHTGLAIAIPAGVECQVRPRSGLALKMQMTVLNSPGTIDPEYRGEIMVIAHNAARPVSDLEYLDIIGRSIAPARGWNNRVFTNMLQKARNKIQQATIRIEAGERIAQLVFAEYVRAVPIIVPELPETVRGAAGFGSTGK